jgi:ABC-2 type transport system ATP-binding protein
MTRADAERETAALLDRLELSARAGDPVEKLSLGNQQRAQIAAALVHRPDVLVLDEPFSGLDPLAVETVLEVLRATAAEGVPVLFSSHQLELVERLCDDVVIISGGTIRAAGTREALRERATPQYELVTSGDVAWVRDVPGVEVVDFAGGTALFEADPEVASAVLARAVAAGPVHAFTPHRPTLAQLYKEAVA